MSALIFDLSLYKLKRTAVLKTIEKKLENGDYSKVNTRYSEALTVMVKDKEYNCEVIVDDIFDEDGEKLFRVERHIEKGGEYFDAMIFDYNKNVYIK